MADSMASLGLSVEAPIDTFEHPDSGSIIEVVSTMHVGEWGYYNRLNRHIGQRLDEGFTILTEGIKVPSAEEVAELSPLDKLKMRIVGRQALYGDLSLELVEKASRFISQYNLDDWIAETAPVDQIVQVDMTQSDVAQDRGLFGLLGGSFKSYAQYQRLKRSHSTNPDEFDRLVYEKIRAEAIEAEARQPLATKTPGKDVIIGGRNQRVVDAIDGLIADDPAVCIALLWGLGHRAGLVSAIQEREYKNTGSSRLTVAFKPPLLGRA